MNLKKHIRNFIITATAGCAIYFAPIADTEASAAQTDFSSNEFREIAQQYVGVPYRWGGTTASGFDCSGYVRQVFKELDVDLPRVSRDMYNVGTYVSKNELLPGDLVFFSASPSSSRITHVGIYYGNGKFIHSQLGDGVSFTSLSDPYYWGDRYVGAKRIAEVQLVSKR